MHRFVFGFVFLQVNFHVFEVYRREKNTKINATSSPVTSSTCSPVTQTTYVFISDSGNTFISASTNMFTSDLVNMFTSDLANVFTSDLANMFTSLSANMFTSDLANMFISDLVKNVQQSLGQHVHQWLGQTCSPVTWPTYSPVAWPSILTSASTNMFTSDFPNMFTSDLANMFTSELEKCKKMIWSICSLVKLAGEYVVLVPGIRHLSWTVFKVKISYIKKFKTNLRNSRTIQISSVTPVKVKSLKSLKTSLMWCRFEKEVKHSTSLVHSKNFLQEEVTDVIRQVSCWFGFFLLGCYVQSNAFPYLFLSFQCVLLHMSNASNFLL